MKHWQALNGGRKVLCLLSTGVPLGAFLLLLTLLGFRFSALAGEGLWWFLLALPALGFLPGAANLVLIFLGHPPRENADLWHALMIAGLLGSLALLGIALFGLLVLGMLTGP